MSKISASVPDVLFTYVQTGTPSGPKEGETWYDTDDDAAKVYDGAAWVTMDVESHGQLTNVGSDNHHTRYADSEAVSAVDGSSLSSLDIQDTFTDPSGTDHTTQLAEISDLPNTLTQVADGYDVDQHGVTQRPVSVGTTFDDSSYRFLNNSGGFIDTVAFSSVPWSPKEGDILSTYADSDGLARLDVYRL